MLIKLIIDASMDGYDNKIQELSAILEQLEEAVDGKIIEYKVL